MRSLLCCVLIPFGVSMGCNRTAPAPAGGNAAAPAAVKVNVAKPKRQALSWDIEQPGTIEPLETTPVMVKFPGYITSIATDEAGKGVALPGAQEHVIDIGSEVKKGQLLATLHIPELDAELKEKKALVAQRQAEKKQAEKDVVVAAAQVAAATAAIAEANAGVARADADVVRWKAELDQVNTQISSGVGDMQTRNVVTRSLEAAKAAKTEAEARILTAKATEAERQARKERAEADVATAQAKVEVAAAEVQRVEVMAGYQRVTAPFSGIITARNVHTGHFSQSTPSNAANAVLFVVARTDVLRVYADIPEHSMGRALPGTAATVTVPSLDGRSYPLTITRTTRIVNPGTRTLRIEIDIDNKDGALKPGTYAVVKIVATAPDALVIPTGCILAADETHSIFVVEGGKVVKYRVQLGHSGNGVIQVMGKRKATSTTGAWEMFGGEEQIVNGNLGALADGTAVRTE